MFCALVLTAAIAAASPQPATGVGGNAKPSTANSHASRAFTGAGLKPGMGTAPPLLKKAAPQPNIHATAGPLLRKAAPEASTNPQGRQALRTFTSAGQSTQPQVGLGNQNGKWGWAGLFGVIGLVGLWRRYSGS